MKFKRLFIKKSMNAPTDETEEGHHELKKHLGAVNLTSIGIGAIIGAGIFAVSGQAAAMHAGPAITLSFLIGALVCFFAGLCYAELSSLIPVSGGSYSYSYITMGEFPAWIVGWLLVSQYLFSSCVVAVSWAGYCVNILKEFGFNLPSYLSHAPTMYSSDSGWTMSGSLVNLPAAIIVAVVVIMISIGIKAATRFNNFMVIIKLVAIALFIILGIAYINTDNWVPFIPQNTGVFGEFGWSGIFRGAGLAFFSYIGYETVSTLAQEAKNPQKDLPRGILGSLCVSTIVYILIALVLTGVLSYQSLNVPDPMSVAMDAMGSHFAWLKLIVKLLILAALATVILVQLMALTRIFMTMGKDRLIPHSFARVHPTTRTPLFSTMLVGIAAVIISGLFPLEILGDIVVMSSLLIYGIVCLEVLILRSTHPKMKRPFKVPFVPFIPIAGMASCLAVMCFLPLETWAQVLVWIMIGMVIYFRYSVQHSKLRREYEMIKK
jgi:basic amino acid/polyamine antiporter, APA family